MDATGWQIATGTGSMMGEMERVNPLAFALLIIPGVLLTLALLKKPYKVLRTIAIVGVATKIVFVAWVVLDEYFQDGPLEFTEFTWLILFIYAGLIGFIQHCMIQMQKTQNYDNHVMGMMSVGTAANAVNSVVGAAIKYFKAIFIVSAAVQIFLFFAFPLVHYTWDRRHRISMWDIITSSSYGELLRSETSGPLFIIVLLLLIVPVIMLVVILKKNDHKTLRFVSIAGVAASIGLLFWYSANNRVLRWEELELASHHWFVLFIYVGLLALAKYLHYAKDKPLKQTSAGSFCSQCGVTLAKNAGFCSSCGCRV